MTQAELLHDNADAGPTLQPTKTVAYFYDPDVGNYSYGYGHPMKPHRMRMTHNLVANYGLDRHMDILRAKRATREQMAAFHTDEYVDFLNRVTPETMQDLTGDGTRFLVGEDCPAFEGLWEFCTISGGGSIAAAERINSGKADIAINWAGGLHHAKKQEASGFCYVNDIVLGIIELLRTYQRVLYIDIDIHHGDGVEEAFYTSDRVMTVSFHKYGDFFPGTGDVRDMGIKKGKGYAVNVPLRDGIDDVSFEQLFSNVLQHIMDWYRPGAVVLQCGADSLAGDKLGCFNLSMQGHAECVRFMKKFNVPLICLGGGGYTIRNVAKTWTYETGTLVGKELAEDLPFNEYIQYFGPEYKLEVPPTSMENKNSREYVEGIQARIMDSLRSLPFAPSVQLQDVPRQSLNVASIDLSDNEDSDLDERITQRMRDAHVSRYGDDMSDDGEIASPRSISRSGIGIAGGPKGSAPWKHGASTFDLANTPRSSMLVQSDAQPQRLKRRFFKARVPDVEWAQGVPHITSDWQDEVDLALASQGVAGNAVTAAANGDAAQAYNRSNDAGILPNAPFNGSATPLNGTNAGGSDRGESPMLTSHSARNSPAIG